MTDPQPALEVLPRDISAYRAGNTGIDYVHRFESGKPGPHVLINALTHGNEFCGMVAAMPPAGQRRAPEDRHADGELRQRRGLRDLRSGQAVRQPADHPQPQPHLVDGLARRRARTASSCAAPARCGRRWPRPTTSSTSIRPARTWCRSGSTRRSSAMPRWRARMARPAVHLVMPSRPGLGHAADPARPHAGAEAPGAALVVECGQHFKQATRRPGDRGDAATSWRTSA